MSTDIAVNCKIREFLRKIRPLTLQRVSRVIDVGCGQNPYKDFFGNSQYIGLDISTESNADIIASTDALPLRSNCFDVVLLTQVLEHLSEPIKALQEARRILKFGGYLVITAPQYWHLHEEPRDFYRFTKYGLRYLLEKAGFEIIILEPQGGRILLVGQILVAFLSVLVNRISRIKKGNTLYRASIPLFMSLDSKYFYQTDTLGWNLLAQKRLDEV